MDLLTKIDSDLIQAQKDKNEFTRDTLRLLKSALKNTSIANQTELTEKDIITTLQKEIKQRKDSVIQYTNAKRPELAEKEQAEITLLETYLPQQLSEDELKQIISQTIAQTGATEIKDMGKVIGLVMPQIQGKAEGSRVSSLVKELLTNE